MKQIVVWLALVLLSAGSVVAQPLPDDARSRIVVTASGSVSLPPDMATVTLTVNREAPTARAAVTASSEAMEQVMSALDELGIERRDQQTTGFSIRPQYTRYPRTADEGGEARKLTGYVVRNTLSVRVRDIGRTGEVLDKAVSLGVNEGGEIAFGIDDPHEALSEARERAVKAAMVKAQTLAAAAGVTLGKVLTITELSGAPPQPRPMELRAMAVQSDVPVAAGENTVLVDVRMTFAIDD